MESLAARRAVSHPTRAPVRPAEHHVVYGAAPNDKLRSIPDVEPSRDLPWLSGRARIGARTLPKGIRSLFLKTIINSTISLSRRAFITGPGTARPCRDEMLCVW